MQHLFLYFLGKFAMSALSNKNYIAIADWMLELGLNTRELLTYAIIYGFSQDNNSCYYGSLEYLASWLGIEDRTNATRYLKPLVDKGLIIKKEVKTKLNQKACLYKTINNKGDITKDPNVDYLIIQPFMLQDLHLNGKDLLLYALVYGYSRKGSNNICSYQKDYFAKWLQCKKNNVYRQVRQALNKGLIIEVDGGFIAKVNENSKLSQIDNTPNLDEIDSSQIDNTYYHSDNTPCLKLTTNKLNSYNLEDNLSFVVDPLTDIDEFDYESFENDISIEIAKYQEAYRGSKEAEDKILATKKLISEAINCYSLDKVKIINKFSPKENRDIFNESLSLTDDSGITDNIRSPIAKLNSKISKYIKRHANSSAK